MVTDHLINSIFPFLERGNHIVVNALWNELQRRQDLLEDFKLKKIKQKMKEMNITSEVNDQTEFGFYKTRNTANEVVEVDQAPQKKNRHKAEFTVGQVIRGHTVLEVNQIRGNGYSLKVKVPGQEDILEISQSKFKEKIGIREYKKRTKSPTQPSQPNKSLSVNDSNTTFHPQKYLVGQFVGNREILKVRKNNRGRIKGFGYLIVDKDGKTKRWVKQSELHGKVTVGPLANNKHISDISVVKDTVPFSDKKQVIVKEEIKKMGFMDRVKMLFA
jgi:hypothetical protein